MSDSPPRILFQLDVDEQPSTFDAVVAIDAGVDHLVTRGGVTVTAVRPLIHGAMFTRGGDDLKRTAIFIGGSDVVAAEHLMEAAASTFFGPVRVSVMLDANGCNTTAAAAVVTASKHVDLAESHAVVLGGTGPVGRRAAEMLAMRGCRVTVTSRSQSRADQTARAIGGRHPGSDIDGEAMNSPSDPCRVCEGASIILGCGAAGIELISESSLKSCPSLRVAIDLNAVPPVGLGGISVTDKAVNLTDTLVGYGAIGVGGLKMKTHRQAIQRLFETNDAVLDVAEILKIAAEIT